MTPRGQNWDPNSDVYAQNEENIIEWEGHMIDPNHRTCIMLEDLPEADASIIASTFICASELKIIDGTIDLHKMAPKLSKFDDCIITHCSHSVLSRISSIYNLILLHDLLLEQRNYGVFAASIGSTNVRSSGNYVLEVTTVDSYDESKSEPDNDDDATISDWDQSLLENFDVYLDTIIADISATILSGPTDVTADHLSKVWRIDANTAELTLDVTTKLLHRSDDPTLSHHYWTGNHMLRYKWIEQYFFTDTFFAHKKKWKSSRGYTCMQLFVTKKWFVHVIPMKSKSEVQLALKMFAKDIGAPDAIICDAAWEQISKSVRDLCHRIETSICVLEEGTPWANHAELYIGLLMEAVLKDMKESDCSLVFWDHCCERHSRINNLLAKNLFQLEGRNAHFSVTGENGDIYNICQFAWYEWCYYREHISGFPLQRDVLIQFLCPAKGEGNEISQWIIKSNGCVVPGCTSMPLTTDQLSSVMENKNCDLFDMLISKCWGTSFLPPALLPDSDPDNDLLDPYEDDDEPACAMPKFFDPVDDTNQLIDQNTAYDLLIHSEIYLTQRGRLQSAKVLCRSLDPSGRYVGTYHKNPIINTLVYDVKFPEEEMKEYSANIISENLLAKVNNKGFMLTVFGIILDYFKDGIAIEKK